MKQWIKIETTVDQPLDRVWQLWTETRHIKNWNHASDDWTCPSATNDLKVGGKFSYRMESKDGSEGFDFTGAYDEVSYGALITYTMEDGRKVHTRFKPSNDHVKVISEFEAESQHSLEQQKMGWQAILDNFAEYANGIT